MYAGYREQVWLNWWIWTVVVAVVVVSSTALLGRGNFGYAFERPPTAILYVFLLLDAIFIPIVLNFRKVEIQVNKESVRVGYGILKKAIPAREIDSCVPARTRLPLYCGVMLRLGKTICPTSKLATLSK